MRPDRLAGFLFNEKTGACSSVEVGVVLVSCCFFRPVHNSLATESDCSGNDGAGKLLWGIKNLEFLLFLGGN